MSDGGIRCSLMRGGTSKGAYFLAEDLPSDPSRRDQLLLAIMGSPDPRQIDGLGGSHPLTSKVAVVSSSPRADADVEYLFLQVGVDSPSVSDRQNCGNLLAGVGQFAVDRGLVTVAPDTTQATVRIHMSNTDAMASATFPVHDGVPVYEGQTSISGVPGTAAAVALDFDDIAGSSCGALLPAGELVSTIEGVDVTCVDNGMPTVVLRAADLGVAGSESPADLEANEALGPILERIRLIAGPLMGLGDVTDATIPKLTLVSEPHDGGSVCTRTFIPHRCHDAIGVLGAVSVATALRLGGVGSELVRGPTAGPVQLEHPTGVFAANVEVSGEGVDAVVGRAGIIRTARKIMDGVVYPIER